MEDYRQLLETLYDHNHQAGYHALLELEQISAASDEVYTSMEFFFAMLKDPNSYVRTRGLRLIVANAKWDQSGMIFHRMQELLKLLHDDKAVVVRKCIQYLPLLAQEQPQCAEKLWLALQGQQRTYSQSMQHLIDQDKHIAMQNIRNIQIAWQGQCKGMYEHSDKEKQG